MESLFMKESAMDPRSFGLNNNTTSNMYGGFGFKSPQENYLLPHPRLHRSSVSSISQLLVDANNAAAGRFGGSLANLPPFYSSLPPAPVHRQPPLLPLPITPVTLPSISNVSTGTGPAVITRSLSSAATSSARQSNNQKGKKKNPKPSTSLKKEPAVAAAKSVKNKAAAAAEEETEEEFLIKPPSSPSVYSMSPPPSSLPLPRLLLMRLRPRTAKVAHAGIPCNAEARGVGVDAGATDDLCKILRL